MTRSRTLIAMAVAASVGTAAWLPAAGAQQSQPQSQQRQQPRMSSSQQMNASERALEDRIYVRLAERAWLGADFKAKVDQGTVTLSGTVPNEQSKQKMLRITRRTTGTMEVRDQLRVDPSVSAQRGGSLVANPVLSQRVAEKIANTITGAKAGEDWWFKGWRVEGPDRHWSLIVEALDGAVTLEGDVPYQSIARKAIEAAVQVQGVRSVNSQLEIEPTYAGYSPYGFYGYPYRYGYYGYSPFAYAADPDYYVYYDARTPHAFTGSSTLTGEVTTIDKQKGTLTLKTTTGTYDFSFPSASLQNVKPGDRISVDVGFREAGASASPRTDATGGQKQDSASQPKK